MMEKNCIPRIAGSLLLAAAYVIVMLFGFLSGMASEGLIGATHPVADVLADAIVCFGAAAGLSPLVPLAAMLIAPRSARTVGWWAIRLLPFVMMAVQLGLIAVAERF